MMIRLYTSTDEKECKELLAAEDVYKTAVGDESSVTFVMENNGVVMGFFTVTLKGLLPILQHFVIRKENRNKKSGIGFLSRATLEMVTFMDEWLKLINAKYFVVNLKRRKMRVCKVVERYFKNRIEKVKEPKDDLRLYLVRVLP